MEVKTSYIVSSILPHLISSKLQKGRERFEDVSKSAFSSSGNIRLLDEPHITLKSSFFLVDTDEDHIIRLLKDITFKPIELSFENAEVFHTTRYGTVIVITATRNPEVIALHKTILANLASHTSNKNENSQEGDKFNPHISFLYNTPEDVVAPALNYISEKILPFSYTLNNFVLYKTANIANAERQVVAEYFAETL